MSTYLTKFETTADYSAFIATDYVKPNVSYVVGDNMVHYNPYVPPRMDVITYEASAKLIETTSTGVASGLHINSFSDTSGQLTITSHTFENGVGTIEFNGDVTSIGGYAFNNCSGLTSVTIPNSVTSIGVLAFSGCSGLTSITIPNSVTSISSNAFSGCSGLTSITVNSNNTIYDSRDNCYAIIKTSTNELVVGCKNTVIPNSVTSIGSNAFGGCRSLTSIDIPNSVTSIGNNTFNGCNGLTSVTIPNSVTSIGDNTFNGCTSLTSIDIPSGVTSIGQGAFYNCSRLTSITIGSGVTSIGGGAFYNCGSLTTITSHIMSAPAVQDGTFYGVNSVGTLYVPIGSTGYDTWMNNQGNLGMYTWTKVEQ